jgi:hypothetical protein
MEQLLQVRRVCHKLRQQQPESAMAVAIAAVVAEVEVADSGLAGAAALL